MIFGDVSVEYICSECDHRISSTVYNTEIPLNELDKVLGGLSRCSKCKNKYTVPHIRCELFKEIEKLKTLDVRMQCQACDTIWNETRYHNTKNSLTGFLKEIKKAQCKSPWCDHEGVKIIKVKNILS